MNALYDSARQRMLLNDFNWPVLTLGVVAWRGPYTFLETDANVADISANGGQLVMVGLPLTNQAAVDGYARSDTAILPNVPASPDPVTFLTLVETAGSVPDAKLIAFLDDAEGLPFVPNGQDQAVQPDWLQMRGWFRP